MQAKVVKSRNFNYLGVRGGIVDETKNTLLILNSRGRRVRVPKRECIFWIEVPEGEVIEVDGKLIAYRPEDRVKRF